MSTRFTLEISGKGPPWALSKRSSVDSPKSSALCCPYHRLSTASPASSINLSVEFAPPATQTGAPAARSHNRTLSLSRQLTTASVSSLSSCAWFTSTHPSMECFSSVAPSRTRRFCTPQTAGDQ